jgi:hypothetical protein
VFEYFFCFESVYLYNLSSPLRIKIGDLSCMVRNKVIDSANF